MVNIVLDSAITSVPTVTIDNVAIGKRIANTFADTGFTSVTVLSTSANTAEQIQSEAFIAQAQARGLTCLPSPSNILEPLRAWIKTLPPKTGIFCTRDAFARRSINASRKTKLTVPQDLSIIGVGNTLTENFLSPISITTQPIPWRQIGEHAARALRQSPTAPHLLPPPPLLIRSSTAVCHADVALAKALTYIEHALADPPDINVLAHAAGLSRRALENRFSNFLNATPAGFWRERQRQKALTLLRTTSQSLDTIAAACGYASASHLSADFKRSNLQRPGSYRP